MNLHKKTILIIGAAGFIGANLTRYLVKIGIKPNILLRKTSGTWRIEDILSKTNPYYVDIRNKFELKKNMNKIKPQIIFHTAVHGGYFFQKDPFDIFETNLQGTINLLDSCKDTDYELFINTGSSSEYGIKNTPMKEDDLLEPITHYGVSKAASTQYCCALAKREKKPIVTLRIFSAYGYYEEPTRLVPDVITACLRNKRPKVSSPAPVRDFIFIEDIINAYIKTTQNISKIAGEIFNIGCGKQYSVGEMVKTIVEITGSNTKPLWKSIPNPRIEPKFWQADRLKAKKILGWQPENNLVHGLEKSIKWFKNNLEFYPDEK